MALIEKLTNIADAIRAKTGKTEQMTLDAMVDEIGAIETGGGELPEEAFNYRGTLDYLFYMNHNKWIIDTYKDKIKINGAIGTKYMFASSDYESIPLEINYKDNASTDYMFAYCRYLKEIPKLNQLRLESYNNMFYNCYSLRGFDEDFGNDIDWSLVENTTVQSAYGHNAVFTGCYSLRKLPMNFIKHYNKNVSYYSTWYTGINNLHSLDEIIDMPVGYKPAYTSNIFGNFTNYCGRLKNVIFETNNGIPYEKEWKSQTINLSTCVGWLYTDALFEYGGITRDKYAQTEEEYNLLKNDNDFCTNKMEYSRYNHDSAVETINSLPDTSAYLAANGGTNTIKFKGLAGSLTDGGAINTLTDEEIAVAAAKGWTVSFT